MMMINKQKAHTESATESGNVMILILIAVALFTTLMFITSRGIRTHDVQMDDRKATLLATEMIEYAKQIERATAQLYSKGLSESQISFFDETYGNTNADYDSSPTQPLTNRIFHPSGGNVPFIAAPSDLAKEGDHALPLAYEFYTGIAIEGVNSSASELILYAAPLKLQLCVAINHLLKLNMPDGTPVDVANISDTKFKGAFPLNDTIGDVAGEVLLKGQKSACVQETSSCGGAGSCYAYYHVLLAR
jgi:hypothetical protein